MKNAPSAPSSFVHYVACWVSAFLTVLDNGTEALTVASSVLLDEDSELYRPVREFLDSRCRRLDSHDSFPDESYMFGEIDVLIYALFPECPGPLVTHECGTATGNLAGSR